MENESHFAKLMLDAEQSMHKTIPAKKSWNIAWVVCLLVILYLVVMAI